LAEGKWMGRESKKLLVKNTNSGGKVIEEI
jgi:hypothetical protein